MEKKLGTTNLCNSRCRTYYMGWAVSFLIGFICCFLWGLLPFIRQPFAWGPFICMLVGVYFFVRLIRCILALMKPEWGKLGKSVRIYSDGTIHTDIQAIFAQIDKDIEENGKKFGKIWVGKDWILGIEAMRIDRIRGIFTFTMWRGKMREHSICLVDDQQNILTTSLTFVKQLDELNGYLTGLLPRTATGNFKDYLAFVAKDKEEMEAFNDEFLHGKTPETSEFVFTGTDGIPTSLATSELIRQSINALQPDEQIRLVACNPPDSEWGNCTGMTCYRLDDEGHMHFSPVSVRRMIGKLPLSSVLFRQPGRMLSCLPTSRSWKYPMLLLGRTRRICSTGKNRWRTMYYMWMDINTTISTSMMYWLLLKI